MKEIKVTRRIASFTPSPVGPEIPKMMDFINQQVADKYYQLLAEHNLNSEDYEPDIKMPGYADNDFENNQFKIVIGVKRKKQIQGINIDKLTFED